MNGETSIKQPTCQSELERAFKYLSLVEEKLWNPTPQLAEEQCVNDKILILKEDISKIANRLEIINETLSILGK